MQCFRSPRSEGAGRGAAQKKMAMVKTMKEGKEENGQKHRRRPFEV
jgi:hypothetical protein